jgi:hypothetical protein
MEMQDSLDLTPCNLVCVVIQNGEKCFIFFVLSALLSITLILNDCVGSVIDKRMSMGVGEMMDVGYS